MEPQGMEGKGKGKDRLKDALVLSAIEKLTRGPTRALEMGRYLLSRGELDSAELLFDQVIHEAQEERLIVAALLGKAQVYHRRRKPERADELLDQAEQLAAKLEPKRLLGLVLWQRAELAIAEKSWAVALDRLRRARGALSGSEVEKSPEVIQVTLRMGLAAQQLFRFREALSYYEEVERLARETEQHNLVLLGLLGQLEALSGLGRNREVLERCEQVEEFIQLHRAELVEAKAKVKVDVQAIERTLMQKKANSYHSLGWLERAAGLYEEALEASSGQDLKERARLHSTLALLKFSMERPQEARYHEEEANKLLAEAGELPEVLLNLARLNLARGQTAIADRQFFRALVELEQGELNRDLEFTLKSIEIDLHLQQGKVAAARELAHALHGDLAALDAEPLLPSVFTDLGKLAQLAGELDEAEGYYRRSLEIAERLELPLSAVSALTGLTKLAAARFELAEAQGYLDRAIQLSHKAGARLQEQYLLVERARLASMTTRMGHEAPMPAPVEPAEVEEEAPISTLLELEGLLNESQGFEALPLKLGALTTLAMAYLREGRPTEARGCLEEAIRKASDAGMEFARILSCGLLGLVLSEMGEEALAGQYLEQALSEMEERGMEIEAKHMLLERYRDLTGFWF